LNTRASGPARQNLRFLKNTGGRRSGPEDRFGLSLFMTAKKRMHYSCTRMATVGFKGLSDRKLDIISTIIHREREREREREMTIMRSERSLTKMKGSTVSSMK